MHLETFYTEVLQIQDPMLVQQMAELTQCVHLSKGELLIQEGERQERFVFLVEGILRGFFSGCQRAGDYRLLCIPMRHACHVLCDARTAFGYQH